MSTLTVGVGSEFDFNTLSSAVAASQNGDVIQVQGGTYTNDFASIVTNITIEGVGGLVNLVATEPPPNLQAILTVNANVTLDNIELSGVAVSDADGGNGAGIRYQGGDLTLDHCYLHGNQDGLLANADPNGVIAINDSEFAGNGNANPPASGIEHNLYVGAIQQLKITNSYFHDAIVGHEIKSRAANTTIENSRIENGPSGTGSYAIDLPNGGNALIKGNVIEKGPNAGNPSFIAYGEEGNVHANSTLNVTGNLVLNDKSSSSTIFIWNQTTTPVSVTGNTFYGLTPEQIVSGPVASPRDNTFQPRSSEPALDTSGPYLPVLPFSFACFAAGTHILTDEGELQVEALRVGQQVVVLQPDEDASPARHSHSEAPARVSPTALCRISWIGHLHIDLTRHSEPSLARPIRVRRNAVADNVPRRDLLVSPDHALYLDGLLIPARLLQNGATILPEDRFDVVSYFHLELDRHGVLLAEDLPAESYLDTGNRGIFDNADAPFPLHPDLAADDGQHRREALSCAPFAADAAQVEPVWRRLADRAVQLGHALREPATTSDPALRISVDGRQHFPVNVTQGRYSFILPRSTRTVRLISRATAPCDVTPWREDRRRLGVAVGRIVATSAVGPADIPVDHPSLTDGWAAPERVGTTLWRWTLGSATLPLPPDVVILKICLVGETTYRLDTGEHGPVPHQGSATV